MHYNYYSNIVLAVDFGLLAIIALTGVVTLIYTILKDYLWKKRRQGLANIKRNVYEMVLAGSNPSDSTCQQFISSVTPQQFIDIATNRSKNAVFFNASEQEFLKKCFVSQEQILRLEKIAKYSANKWRKIEAILCLGYTQKQEAVDIIKKSLFSRDSDIAYFSIISLGQIKSRESAQALLKRLKKDALNNYKIISILESFPVDIAGDIIELVHDHNPAVRERAAMLLSKFNAAPYIKELKKLSEDKVPEVRAAACDCLAANTSDKNEGIKILKECLKDDNWLVRRHAVLALEKSMGGKAVDEVVSMMNDASWSVVDAVRDVMIMHIEVSIPYIEKFLGEDYGLAKKYSVLALEESGYMVKILKDAAMGVKKDAAVRLLSLVVKAGFGLSVESAISMLEQSMQPKAIEIFSGIIK